MQHTKTGSSPSSKKKAQFHQVCLRCGRETYSLLYSCSCSNDEWTTQYRTIDIQFDAREKSVQSPLFESFRDYSFRKKEGMLQYKGLPYQAEEPPFATVGLTPLYELRHLSQAYGCRLHLKNEGDNPTGCFKDRETMMCWLNSRHQGLSKAVIYSSGNAAASAASFAEHSDHHLVTFVPGDTYTEKIDFICNHGTDVVVIGDGKVGFEEGYRLFSKINDRETFINHNYDNWSVRNPFRVQGDKTIALEIVKQLSPYNDVAEVPDYVLVPTANGSCLAGIWKGFKELKQMDVIPSLPRLISVGLSNANPVNKAVRSGELSRPVRCEVNGNGGHMGSIIRAEEGYDSIEAARAVLESGGAAIDIEPAEIQETLTDFLEKEGYLAIKKGILPEPAALTSVAAARKAGRELGISPGQTLVSMITGHGLKAVEVINAMLEDRPILRKKVKQIVTVRENKMMKSTAAKGEVLHVEPDLEAVEYAFSVLKDQR